MGRILRPASAVATLLLVAGVGCSSASDPTSTASSTTTTSDAPPRVELARFTAVMDHTLHKLVFTPVPASTGADSAGNVSPQSINSVPSPSGQNGTPGSGTVDLVTTGCTDGFPTTPSFSCDVNLISGFSRSLPNVYVQITDAKLNGTSTTAYDATNSDPELVSTNDGSLTQDHGLWSYGNASFGDTAGGHPPPWPVIGASGSGFNSATRTWTFANPGDANVVYTIVVWATQYWATFTAFGGSNGDNTYGNMGYTDACSGGTQITGGNTLITLPFDFTLYNTNTKSIAICPLVGELATATSACTSAFVVPKNLPASSFTNNPVFFPFWEKLKYGTAANDQAPADTTPAAGRVCYKTIGTAPNRMEAIEWRNMDFSNAPDQGSSLNFEAYLYEGTNEIDLYYNKMGVSASDTGTNRQNCNASTTSPVYGCWVGGQGKDNTGSTGTSNTSLTAAGSFGSGATSDGAAVTFIPAP